MRKADSDQNGRRQLERRRYIQIIAGGSILGIAGCAGNNNEGNGNASGNGNGNASGNGNGNTSGNGNGGEDLGDPQRERIRVHVNNVPEMSDINEFNPNAEDAGFSFLTELSAPEMVGETANLLDGHTYDAHWIRDTDEISVPTMYTDFEVEEPYDIQESFNENLTYWDGTSITAEARFSHNRLDYLQNLFQFDDDEEFTSELVGEYELHRWMTNPHREEMLIQEATPSYNVPLHPDFTEPWVETLEEADTADDAEQEVEELHADSISMVRLAEEGWGSGLYEVDPDDIGEDALTATMRDDHPNEHAQIPELRITFGDQDRASVLAGEGETDLSGDVITQEGGIYTREQLPDHMQQLSMYPEFGGDQILFNWNNPHLGNVWVRRAIVAAVDWYSVGENGWGAEKSVPVEYHTGLIDSASEIHFDEGFLDSLYSYSAEADIDQAHEYLEQGGYTQEGSGWVSANGEDLTLTWDSNNGIPEWVSAGQTIQGHLEQAGFAIDFESVDQTSWAGRRDPSSEMNYEFTMMWGGSENPWNTYHAQAGQGWDEYMVGSDPEAGNPIEPDPDDHSETDQHGRPFEPQVPTEAGSIDANEEGTEPEVDAEQVNLIDLVQSLRDPEVGDEQYQENLRTLARYYNFYLPNYFFHEYMWGQWGNVRDFEWPDTDYEALQVSKDWDGTDYLCLSGIPQFKYDDEFPDV